MIAEIITIGDELLYGARIDTNSAFIGNRLDSIGIEVRYMTSTGDNMDLMIEAITLALRRADIVLTTGGLGPTDDDITKNAVCKVFKRNLIFHEEILESLQLRYTERGLDMPAINQNQALLPQGARFLANKTGSALGILIEERGKLFCAMPGVPSEMRPMVDEELLPVLTSKLGDKVIIRKKLRTIGITEAVLAEKIRPTLKFAEGVSLAYLPSYRGVDLCIKGIGTVAAEVESGVDLLAAGIRDKAGKYIFTEDDREIEEVVGALLIERGQTLAVAESCTGGLLGGRLTSTPGSSDYFLGGIIAYSNEVKIRRLGVSSEIIERYGAVSAECAKAMASGVIEAIGSDIGISITGVAGPDGGTPEKPVGTVFMGLATTRGAIHRKFTLGTDREINRERAVSAALNMIRRELLGIA
ncbi:MAG: competence/damage-inducible protein A [Candidatus Zixiibacteriota bacterium]